MFIKNQLRAQAAAENYKDKVLKILLVYVKYESLGTY